ncbi:BTB/POZ domain-containing protein 6-like [Montipora foliosa]|uniref:BTB/POZ domain-containing protein 6-like n=1 Tax=Montipora foliosa TaxID=591990 RepID=UPI0035F137F2
MSVRQESWQTKKRTIRERSKFMFNNDLFSDVKFVVRKSDGESESKIAIPAHKLMLSIGSPVFEAMFYGDLAETSDSIELPDCKYESLLELFRYLYSDKVKLSGSNVMEVLYLAKKYIVPSLAVKCTEYLQDHLEPSNVFNILVSARKCDEEQLVDRCWEMIDKQTLAAVKSEGFAMIERPLLEELVERDTLDIPEAELFKGVVQWAEMEAARHTMVADGEEKRKIIGERIMKAIRFPVMKQDEFAFVVLDSKILSYDEVSTLIKYFNSKNSFPIEFPVSKRSGPLRKITTLLKNYEAPLSRPCTSDNSRVSRIEGRQIRYEESRVELAVRFAQESEARGGISVEGRHGLVSRYLLYLE